MRGKGTSRALQRESPPAPSPSHRPAARNAGPMRGPRTYAGAGSGMPRCRPPWVAHKDLGSAQEFQVQAKNKCHLTPPTSGNRIHSGRESLLDRGRLASLREPRTRRDTLMPITRSRIVIALLCAQPHLLCTCFGEVIVDAQHIHTRKASKVDNDNLKGEYGTRAQMHLEGREFADPRHAYPNPDPEAAPSHHLGRSAFTYTQSYHRTKGTFGVILPGKRQALPVFTLGLLTEDNALFCNDPKTWTVSFTRPENPTLNIKKIDAGFTFKEVGANFGIEWFEGRDGLRQGIDAQFNGSLVRPELTLTYAPGFDFDNGTLRIEGIVDVARFEQQGFGRVRSLGSATVIEPANAWLEVPGVIHSFDAPVYDVLYSPGPDGVPEIDPASCGSVVAFVIGALGFVERKSRRRWTSAATFRT